MALVEARATTAAASFGSSQQARRAMEQHHPHPYDGASASASAAAYYGAAAFPPHAAFGAGRQLDVFDYLSDEGVPATPAAVPAGAFGPPPRRTPVEQVVPDAAGGYYALAAGSAAAVAVAGQGSTRTDRIAFRMRSEEDVLDDGYKWRKYGKKSVKNSPNPRNYYRCSTEGCNVKKRVERDRDDPSYVVTMYEGVHNHATPGTIYYASQDAASGRFFVSRMHHQLGS